MLSDSDLEVGLFSWVLNLNNDFSQRMTILQKRRVPYRPFLYGVIFIIGFSVIIY